MMRVVAIDCIMVWNLVVVFLACLFGDPVDLEAGILIVAFARLVAGRRVAASCKERRGGKESPGELHDGEGRRMMEGQG
jgi:hypothetical protein